MLWAVGSALGLALMTGVILALARPITKRWEQERATTPAPDE